MDIVVFIFALIPLLLLLSIPWTVNNIQVYRAAQRKKRLMEQMQSDLEGSERLFYLNQMAKLARREFGEETSDISLNQLLTYYEEINGQHHLLTGTLEKEIPNAKILLSLEAPLKELSHQIASLEVSKKGRKALTCFLVSAAYFSCFIMMVCQMASLSQNKILDTLAAAALLFILYLPFSSMAIGIGVLLLHSVFWIYDGIKEHTVSYRQICLLKQIKADLEDSQRDFYFNEISKVCQARQGQAAHEVSLNRLIQYYKRIKKDKNPGC
ncbi:MAG: hypothetical protein K0S07_1503 [Chlamydiales bacterium]|jgi:hypothetical protein|nr:hypothetical protein [Chlamydiales bacterium]